MAVQTDSPRTEVTLPPTSRNLKELKRDLQVKLKPISSKWKRFGVQLKIPSAELRKLEGKRRKPCDCFYEVIDFWLQDGAEHRWKTIFKALEYIDKRTLMRELQKQHKPEDIVKLDEMGLVNKLKGIEDKWKLFGSQLGLPSSTLNTIADEKSDDHCLNDVLDVWLDNNYSENNLETLCKALKNIDNKRLANEINQDISTLLQSSPPSRHVETDTATNEVQTSVEEQTLCEENEMTGRLSQLTLESHNSQQTSDQPSYSKPEQASDDSVYSHPSQVYNEPLPESS